jgi:homoserine kinase
MSSGKEIRVRVPASSANLGPGFDALALALGLYLRCTLRPSKGGLKITATGTDASEIPADESNLIWKTFAKNAGENASGAFELEIANEIPLGRGLGSSAAAIVAGLALADAWSGTKSGAKTGTTRGKQWLIEAATGLEGHPDNVSAAALGGLVVSCQTDDGRVLTAAGSVPRDVQVVLVVPEQRLSTEAARAVLPQHYARQDAVFNVQRAALFLAALQSGRTDLLREAMRDRIHQPYRAPLIPGFTEALQVEGVPGLLGVALSGAGPSVIALCQGDGSAAGAAIAGCFRRKGIPADATVLSIDPQGLITETN